jgi:hypothetical protein
MFKWLYNLMGWDYGDKPIKSDAKRIQPVRARDEFAKVKPATFGGATLKLYEEPETMYNGHDEAVIVSCFFNPQNSPYRLLAFQKWYRSIKHLNHRIIELLIGENAVSQLPKSPYITTIKTDSLLFHKESLLNKLIAELPPHFKYVFWVDADLLFTNPNWIVDGVEQLKKVKIIQPFEFGIHLERNQLQPDFDVEAARPNHANPNTRNKKMWRSFSANFVDNPSLTKSPNYDIHGHVGFAWAARREVLDAVQLYDRALIGGADHIIAHAAAWDEPSGNIKRAFSMGYDDVFDWSKMFHQVVGGSIGYVTGDVYHIWHGDIKDREYLKRIKDFATEICFIQRRDKNGLWVYEGKNPYMSRYYHKREAVSPTYYSHGFDGFDFGFAEDMGYALADLISSFGRPTYEEYVEEPPATLPFEPTQSSTQTYEPGHFDYKGPADDVMRAFEQSHPQVDEPVVPAVQSFTPSYEPGHWDYTPPGQEDLGSTFS